MKQNRTQFGLVREMTNRGGYICSRCDGFGYKRFTDEHPVVERKGAGFVTIHQGCGCTTCLGMGIVMPGRQ